MTDRPPEDPVPPAPGESDRRRGEEPPPAPAQAEGPTREQDSAAGPDEGPRRLTRSADDRIVAGVSGGLGRYFGVDPILFRLAFVTLAVAGGIGFVAYLAGWALMPVEGRPPSERNRTATILLIALLVLVLSPILDVPTFFVGPPLIALLLFAGLGYLLWRAIAPERGGGNALVGAGIGLLVLAACIVAAAAVGFASATGAGWLIAGLLILVGFAMAVGAFTGGARWMILPALVLALPLAVVAAADIDVSGPVGELEYRPDSLEELRSGYEIGMGDMRLDLRDVDFPDGRTDLAIDVGVGNASVIVPEDVDVAAALDMGIGRSNVLGRVDAGLDLEVAHASMPVGSRRPQLALDADVGVGNLEVCRETDAVDPVGGPFERRSRGRDMLHCAEARP